VVDLDDANTVRAGVFGVQDGIVSTFGLVMGVAGAQVSPEGVLIAGLAGAFSGAISMGAGEYVSVKVQRELLEARGNGSSVPGT
jgi:vacuolar iron transporter family protein